MSGIDEKYIDEKYITIGKIVNTQGNRGMLRVLPLTDFTDRFQDMNEVEVLLGRERKTYHLEQASKYKQFIVVKFKEVPDMNAAVALKGALLQVTRDNLVNLPKDTFYIFDIVGLDVYDINDIKLGRVEDIIQTGANDVYVVESEGKRPLLVPALKKVVKEIDLADKRMTVELPEGLEDI